MFVRNCVTGNYYYDDKTTLDQLANEFKLVIMPILTYESLNTRFDVFRRDSQGKVKRWLGNATLSQIWVDITSEYGVTHL